MSVKVFLYLFSSIVVIWAIDSVNITQIFKKNKMMQAKVFYFLLAISMIQLLTMFLYDLFEATKFV